MDFVSDAEAEDGALADYRLLIVPFRPNVSETLARSIEGYVEEGGHVVTEAFFGFKDDGGVLQLSSPAKGLERVFGCRSVDALPSTGEAITMNDGAGSWKMSAHVFRQELTPAETATVRGTFPDDVPAIVEHSFGAGRTLMAGTMLFAQYAEVDAGPVERLLASFIEQSGVRKPFLVEPAGDTSEAEVRLIEVCGLESSDTACKQSILILNHADRRLDVSIRVAGDWFGGGIPDSMTDHASGASHRVESADGWARITLAPESKQAMLLVR